jgi:putative FmdB family regulatory protein
LPLYPYRCTQCGHRFEKIQKFNDEPLTECPKCGGALERPLTVPGLKFVGAGWYANTPGYGLNVARGVATDPSENKPESKAPAEKGTSPAPAAPASTATGSTS